MDNVMFIPPRITDEYAEGTGLGFGYITEEYVRTLIKPRAWNSHKGNFGHALLVCGSRGMIGAASLSTGAALRSGCGLVTIHIPESERFPVEANFPSALFSLDPDNHFSTLPDNMDKFNAVGVGCGLGQDDETVYALQKLLMSCKEANTPVVIDADAINILAANNERRELIPDGAVMTPHMGELERLIGRWSNEEEKIDKVAELARATRSIVIVKGPNTAICDRGESMVFNSTGNSGMAKGGSGDVLTGLITGLIARGYTPFDASVIGVYVHGLAGDKACEYYGAEGMNSSDLLDFIPEAIKEIE